MAKLYSQQKIFQIQYNDVLRRSGVDPESLSEYQHAEIKHEFEKQRAATWRIDLIGALKKSGVTG